MDWFSWLSKTGLEPSLVYEYGLSFAENQLEEDDVAYFNHEFLQSMGISIAKHRLQILKLAAKQKERPTVSIIMVAIKRLSKYLRPWPREDSALALVPKHSYWNKRNRKIIKSSTRAPLLLTNGTPLIFHSSRIDSFSSPVVVDDQKMDGESCHRDYYWSSAVQDIRWDAMFHNLKPT